MTGSPHSGVHACEQRLQLVPADRVALEQLPVDQPVAGDHVQQRERQGGVAARERLQVQVGRCAVGVRIGSTTITVPGASGSQCSWACGAEAEGFAPHTMMQSASPALRGSKPVTELPYM